MSPPWHPDIDAFPAQIDGNVALVVFDLEAERRLPDPALCMRIRVLVPMAVSDPRGLAPPLEAAALDEAGERLDEVLGARGAVRVAQVTYRGTIEFVYYGPDPGSDALLVEEEVHRCMQPRQASVEFEDDADASFFRETLAPNAFQRQRIWNRRTAANLGLELSTSQTIAHRAMIPTAKGDVVRGRLEAAGFAFLVSEDPEEVQFARSDALDTIDRVTDEILTTVLGEGGSYLGWDPGPR